jgi:hypothetical protein
MTDVTDLSRKTAALLAMSRAHPGAMIDNLETTAAGLQTSLGEVPVTRNDGEDRTCYVCCPSVAYIDYALSELRHFEGNAALSAALHALVAVARPVIATTGIDRHLQLNNWLLATNPALPLAVEELTAVTRALIARHPGHAVICRSLNAYSDSEQIVRFTSAGYDLFPARQIYLFDCRGAPPAMHRDERRDRLLLEAGDYEVVAPEQIEASDHARMAELYGYLYLDKYTRLNPQYSADYMASAHRSGLVSFYGVRQAGRLDGMIGFFELGDVMTAPVVGYDTSKPQQLGLYRRLMAIGLERARLRRMLFNMSAGAASFKRNRGAVPAIEYAAVYNRHLAFRRRFACWIVRAILEKVGPPLLKRFEL